MKKISSNQKQVIAEFLANIGVAWFAAGVIGTFLSKPLSIIEIIISFSWGVGLSIIFLFSGLLLLRG